MAMDSPVEIVFVLLYSASFVAAGLTYVFLTAFARHESAGRKPQRKKTVRPTREGIPSPSSTSTSAFTSTSTKSPTSPHPFYPPDVPTPSPSSEEPLPYLPSRNPTEIGGAAASSPRKEHRVQHKRIDRSAYRLLRFQVVVTAVLSVLILVPALVFRMEPRLVPGIFCWIQGVLLQLLTLMQYFSFMLVSVNMYLLIVHKRSHAEQRYWLHYLVMMVLVPAIIVGASFGGYYAMSTKPATGTTAAGFGMQPGAGAVCEYRFMPGWFRLVSEDGWLMLASVISTLFAVWIPIYLFHMKRKLSHAASTIAAQSPHSPQHNKKSSRLHKTISSSILYRTAAYAILNLCVLVMTFYPSLLLILNTFSSVPTTTTVSNSAIAAQRRAQTNVTTATNTTLTSIVPIAQPFTLGNMASASMGIGMFLIFGTGLATRTVLTRWFFPSQAVPGPAGRRKVPASPEPKLPSPLTAQHPMVRKSSVVQMKPAPLTRRSSVLPTPLIPELHASQASATQGPDGAGPGESRPTSAQDEYAWPEPSLLGSSIQDDDVSFTNGRTARVTMGTMNTNASSYQSAPRTSVALKSPASTAGKKRSQQRKSIVTSVFGQTFETYAVEEEDDEDQEFEEEQEKEETAESPWRTSKFYSYYA